MFERVWDEAEHREAERNRYLQLRSTVCFLFSCLFTRSDVENAPDCTICLETLKKGDEVKKLPCGHVFHSACVTPWLIKKRPVCPVCRQGIFEDDMLVESADRWVRRRIGCWRGSEIGVIMLWRCGVGEEDGNEGQS